jgi:hypothetical protein
MFIAQADLAGVIESAGNAAKGRADDHWLMFCFLIFTALVVGLFVKAISVVINKFIQHLDSDRGFREKSHVDFRSSMKEMATSCHDTHDDMASVNRECQREMNEEMTQVIRQNHKVIEQNNKLATRNTVVLEKIEPLLKSEIDG